MSRPKWFFRHGNMELRVEQIGVRLWHVAIYRGVLRVELNGKEVALHIWAEPHTAPSENTAKDLASHIAECLEPNPTYRDPRWDNLADPEEPWVRRLRELEFRGYYTGGFEAFPEVLALFSRKALEPATRPWSAE